jgi:di/tricarboxylate transporter
VIGPDGLILIGILFLMVCAFAFEWANTAVVALAVLALLAATGLVTSEEALSGFSNEAVFTVLMMFWLSESLVRSGLIGKLGYRIANLAGASGWSASMLLLALVGSVSAFINNTAAVAIFIPVAMHLARHYRFSPSKILLPLSWIAILGGTSTLFGTSTNIVVNSLSPIGNLGVFSFARFGLVMLAVGFLYIAFFAFRYLPPRATLSPLTRKYHLAGYLTELRVPEGSRLIGRTVVDERVSERLRLNVLEIIRGGEKISTNLRHEEFRKGDLLIVRGDVEDIIAFREEYGLLLLTDVKISDADLSDRHNVLAEVQVTPLSNLVGKTLQETEFRRRSGCFVLALNRTGETILDRVARVRIRAWDLLLVFGPRTRVEALYEDEGFLAIGEREMPLHLPPGWWLSPLVIVSVVLLSALGLTEIHLAALIGVVVLFLSKALTVQAAFTATDWSVIVLLAAILPLGAALETTGLAGLLGGSLAFIGDAWGPWAMLSIYYAATSLLTSLFSNTATAVVMVPIAISAAASQGVDVRPFLMATAFAASCDFATPIGYQTNAMVFGPGSYRFKDYAKFGAPLNVAYWILASLLIPVLWSF